MRSVDLRAALSPRATGFAKLLEDRPTGDTSSALRIVTGLEQLGSSAAAHSTPRPEFQAQLRARLAAVASLPVPEPAPVRRRHRATRPAIALAGLTAAAVAVGGVGLATSKSLPGEPLYVLKRGTEELQLQTANGTLAEGRRHLQLAETRLREVRSLADQGETAIGVGSTGRPLAAIASAGGDLVNTLQDMDSETRAGERLLVKAADEMHSNAPLIGLKEWSAAQSERIAAVLPTLPAVVRQQAQASLKLVAQVQTVAITMLVARPCNAVCLPGESPSSANPTPSTEVAGPLPTGTPEPSAPLTTSLPQPPDGVGSTLPIKPEPSQSPSDPAPALPSPPPPSTEPASPPPTTPLPTTPLPTTPGPTTPAPTDPTPTLTPGPSPSVTPEPSPSLTSAPPTSPTDPAPSTTEPPLDSSTGQAADTSTAGLRT